MEFSGKSIEKLLTEAQDEIKHLDIVRELYGLPRTNVHRFLLGRLMSQKEYTTWIDPESNDYAARDVIQTLFEDLHRGVDHLIDVLEVADIKEPKSETYEKALEHIEEEVEQLQHLLAGVQFDEDLDEIRTHPIRVKITELKHSKNWSRIADSANRRAFDRVQKRVEIEFSELMDDIMSIRKRKYENRSEGNASGQGIVVGSGSDDENPSIVGSKDGKHPPPPH